MQRRKFIQSTANFGIVSLLPVSAFSNTQNGITQDIVFKKDIVGNILSEALTKLETQTIIVKCKGQDVKIHAIQTGTCAIKKSHMTNHTAHFFTPLKITLDKHFTEFLPIWVWVIEHPEGVIVIDTGENADVMNPEYFKSAGKLVAAYNKRNIKFNVSKENEIGFQLLQLGINNDKIKNVVLTHLHLDHTDGLKDFPKVEIIVNNNEFEKPSGHISALIPNWFKPKTVIYKRDFIEIFKQAYPITQSEDMLLIPTNGHTPHHASVLFKTDEFDVLFAGDVCYNEQQLKDRDLPGINVDFKASRNTYQNITDYAQYRKLIFLPSHDPDSAERLKEKKCLKTR